jgi:hypothetical protein|tara:strand:+ start:840 stop:1010 length:171 start_codon:yes stop_codon:yes gene_type:complete
MIEIKNRLDSIMSRVDEINEFFDIYNITDEDSINSVKEEIDNYKKEIKKISDEKLK